MKLPKMKFTAAGDMLIQRLISTEYEGFETVKNYICKGDARFFNFESIIYRDGIWGNYFNGEAHGGPTDLPWAVIIDGQTYHPTFLYESIWCFILFLVLIYVDNHRKFEGQVLLLYGTLYSVERFFVEALRTDSLMIGPFKQAQVISLVIIVICLIAYLLLKRKGSTSKRKGSTSRR